MTPSVPAPPAPGPRATRAPATGELRLFLVVAAAALVARLVVRAELAGSLLATLPVGDAELYDRWARELAAGGGLDEPVLFQSPLYPLVLSLVYRAVGPEPGAMLVLQALAGALGCGALALASRRLFGAAAGWCAGLLAAVYAPALWYDGLLHKTSLALALTAALVLACVPPPPRPERPPPGRALRAALCGLALGLLALLRPNALVLAPVLLAWLLLAPSWTAAGSGGAARAALFVLALSLSPAALGVRNLRRGDAFFPVAANMGVNFYQGNGADADGLYRPLIPGRAHPDFEAADARELAERSVGRPLGAAEVNRYWLSRAWHDVRAAPGRWFRLLGRKLGLALHADEAMDALALEAFRARSRVLDLAARLFSFGTLLPLAALGLWSSRGRWRELWFLPAGFLALLASIVLFLVVGRLRAGLVPFLVPLAGAGAVAARDVLGRARAGRPGALVAPAAVVGAAVLVTLLPTGIAGDPVAATHANLAARLLRDERFDEALREARHALRRDPRDATARFNAGSAAAALGLVGEAREHLEAAARLEPAFAAAALDRLGTLVAEDGELADAEELVRRALEADPLAAMTRYRLGLTLRGQGRIEEALAAYEQALRIDPGLAVAHHNLGFLLEGRGRLDEAMRHYRAALEGDPGFVASRLRLAWLLAVHPDPDRRDASEAVELAEQARELGADDCGSADVLAAAYAAAGRRDAALATLDGALERLAPGSPEARALAGRRARYADGRPPWNAPGAPPPSFCGS